jgi:hypothetical protein
MSDQNIEEMSSDVFGQQLRETSTSRSMSQWSLACVWKEKLLHRSVSHRRCRSSQVGSPPEPIATQGAIHVAIPSPVAVTQPMPVAATQGASPLRQSTRVSKPEVFRNNNSLESVTTNGPDRLLRLGKQSITANRVSLQRSNPTLRDGIMRWLLQRRKSGSLSPLPVTRLSLSQLEIKQYRPHTCFHHGESARGWYAG